jgi:exopolyphosphatase/guanosine-5'-triphosphate,3'-diphosphate pyrophosphatase
MVVDTLIEQLGFKRLVISAYGIREGLLFEAMPPDVRGLDPLVQGHAALGARQGAAEALGPALADWLEPAFADLPPVFSPERDAILTAAASRLADVGARLHPAHRADLAFAQVLRAPVAGQSHAERAFLATAVHARYGGQPQTPEPEVVERLLSDERFDRARALGLAMRLGCDLSGRTPALLAASALRLQRDRLLLTAAPEWADMLLGEQTTKRAGALAQALGLDLVAAKAA